MNEAPLLLTIAVLGGTGKEGKGLAYPLGAGRLSGHHRVSHGREGDHRPHPRSSGCWMAGHSVVGMSNAEAVAHANIVVLTVPYAAHAETLEAVKTALQGKLLIDVTVPLMPPKRSKVQMPPAGSAAQEARQILGEGAEVAAAFHTISHEYLMKGESARLAKCW